MKTVGKILLILFVISAVFIIVLVNTINFSVGLKDISLYQIDKKDVNLDLKLNITNLVPISIPIKDFYIEVYSNNYLIASSSKEQNITIPANSGSTSINMNVYGNKELIMLITNKIAGGVSEVQYKTKGKMFGFIPLLINSKFEI